MFDDRTILITSGTGSFGKTYIDLILRDYAPRKVNLFSRDELKQFEMLQVYCAQQMRYFHGVPSAWDTRLLADPGPLQGKPRRVAREAWEGSHAHGPCAPRCVTQGSRKIKLLIYKDLEASTGIEPVYTDLQSAA